MTTKRRIKSDVDSLKKETNRADDHGPVAYYRHPDTGDLYDPEKNVTADPTGIIVALSWRLAPFVVERDKAEAEGWEIIESVDVGLRPDVDYVEVAEWDSQPWIDEQ